VLPTCDFALRLDGLRRTDQARLGGPRIAAILSIVETCRRLKIPIRDYLASILPGFADVPVSRIAELSPAARACAA
jgi:hypothetical protein